MYDISAERVADRLVYREEQALTCEDAPWQYLLVAVAFSSLRMIGNPIHTGDDGGYTPSRDYTSTRRTCWSRFMWTPQSYDRDQN
jgi:hypothetical protein